MYKFWGGGGGDARNLTFAQFASEPCNMLESSWGEPEPSNNISTNFEHILLHVFPEMLCTNSVGGRGGGSARNLTFASPEPPLSTTTLRANVGFAVYHILVNNRTLSNTSSEGDVLNKPARVIICIRYHSSLVATSHV